VSGSGEPVLLIHGSIFADAFPPLLPEPALSNYQLITYDRRGFAGSSRAPVPFTIEQQAADAIALLDKLDIRRAHVVGASYGGTIALQMARQYPDRLASLSLFEAAVPSLDTMDPRLMEAVHAAGELYGKGDARGAVSRFVNAVVPGAWDRMTAEGATAMQEQAVADAGTFFEVELPALQAWQYSASDLANVKTPTLVVLGGKTDPSSRTSHGQLLRGIKGAQELVVQGAGHELHMSQPKSVADALAAFLRQHPIR
jgi:3-oxoadipate enol-lactonase